MPIFTGGLDTRLPLEARQPQYDLAGAIMQGMQIGNAIKSQVVERKKQQGMAELLNNPNIRDENGLIDMQKATPELQKYGGLSAALYPALNQMAQEQNKSFFENQKTRAETGLVGANTTKANTDVQKTNFEIGKGKSEALTTLMQGQRALGGDANLSTIFNGGLPYVKSGLISLDDLTSFVDELPRDPAQLHNTIQSFTPIDNQTQEQGQNLVFGANEARLTQDANQFAVDSAQKQAALAEQQRQFDLKQEYESNKGTYVKGSDGRDYIQRPDGSLMPATVNGAQIEARADMRPLSATLQKELIESDDIVNNGQIALDALQKAQELNKIAYSGIGALTRAKATSHLKDSINANATVDLDNIIATQALSQLKTMFGAAPTEGERRILMEIQGSVNLQPEQREAIYKRAADLAQIRINNSMQRAESIRSGSYTRKGNAGNSTQNPFQAQPSTWAEVGKVVSMADAKTTALASGKTTQQVINDLRSKGIQVK